MTDGEKNLHFICFLVFAVVLLAGIGAVDGNLGRLMLPNPEFRTVALSYDHGLAVLTQQASYRLPAFNLAALELNGDWAAVNIGSRRIRLPLGLDLIHIEQLRRPVQEILTN